MVSRSISSTYAAPRRSLNAHAWHKTPWVAIVVLLLLLGSALASVVFIRQRTESQSHASEGLMQGEELVSRTAKVSASATVAGSSPQNVVDGLLNTEWSAGNASPQWIELDLGREYKLSRIRLRINQSPAGRTLHQVFIGSTSNPSQLVRTVNQDTKTNTWLEVHVLPSAKPSRFVRVLTTQSPSWVSWFEVEVYGRDAVSTTGNGGGASTPAPTPTPATSNRVVMADFYGWYPYYGVQYPNPSTPSQFLPAEKQTVSISQNGASTNLDIVGQNPFSTKFTQPIPYLKSSERPQGTENERSAINWYKSNFQRAAAAEIDVMAVMTRPDLPMWPQMLQQMLRAQAELRQEGKRFPKLLFHLDGVEYWEPTSPKSGDLTKPGQDYDVIWKGVKSTFDTVQAQLTPEEVSTYLFTYPDKNTFPMFVYRIEGDAQNFVTSNWWMDQLRQDFRTTYPGRAVTLIPDDLWCGAKYGINNSIVTNSCNGDNYYVWGAALEGTKKSVRAKSPLIVTVGPGFDNSGMWPQSSRRIDRQDGQLYRNRLQEALKLNPDWILLETWNFGEEGTGIDESPTWGTTYLQITKQLLTPWKRP